MPGKPAKRQLEPRCPYASRKLPRGACPLPSLLASVGALQPVHTVTLQSVMGGCEIVDYASRTGRSEERLVVDLAMIGHDFSQPGPNDGPITGNSMFQQQPIIVNADQLVSSDPSRVIKDEELSPMETQKLINNNNSTSSSGNNSYEYANLIEGMINNVMESATNVKSMDKENNNNNNENSFEFFNYENNQIVELTTADSSAPVIISLQNFYDPLNTSHTTTQISHFQPIPNMSTNGTVCNPSPTSTIDMDNEQNQYCNLDTYKVYRENIDGTAFPGVVQSERVDLGMRGLGNFDAFFEFDSFGQRLTSHTGTSMTSFVADDITQSTASVPRKRRKREQRILPNWDKEKRICCSLCSKKFRTAAHLKTHFVVHSMGEGVKPSRCVVCNKGFCHRGALTLHMRAHASKVTPASRLRGEGC